MKITCQACQAKYTIADEKVAGKVVKIRCKKCGASIVVNGNQTSPDATQPTVSGGAFESGRHGVAAEAWTVNVADGDQRTMTESEIVVAYGAGVVTDDTFCWKEGMPDWLPVQEIAPLLAACKGQPTRSGGGRPGNSDMPTRIHRPGDSDVPTRIHDPSGGALGMPAPGPAAAAMAASGRKDGNGAVAAPPPAATARRAGGRGAVADLFGGVAQAGGEDEVLTSAPPGIPQAHVEAPKPIGARNESSLLFATQEQGNAAAAPSMVATNEASGLIDIRQLSAQMRSSADDNSKKKSRVDDIMNLGGGGAFSPSLAAPILSAPSLEAYSQPPPPMVGAMGSEAPPARSKALVFLAISAGLFFLIAAASVALLLLRGKGGDEASLASAREPAPLASASGATTLGPYVRGGETPQASAGPAPEASGAAATGAAPKEPAKEAKESAPASPAPPAGPKEPKAAAPAPPKEGAPTGAPVAEFNMGEARGRLASIAGGVQSCKRGETTGGGKVEIVFAPSGAVQSASLMPGSPFDGSPTGKCVEARFRGARVPPFGGSPFTVSKSFSIN
jgi:predicted Zn finger-like uncharacterized protein